MCSRSGDGSIRTQASDHSGICKVVASEFADRWGAGDLQTRASVLDFVHSAEGRLPDLETMDFVIAIHKLKRWEQLDIDRIYILLLRIVFSCVSDRCFAGCAVVCCIQLLLNL